jgi:hypothetical protein
MMKTIFVTLDHGLSVAYFFETDLIKLLLEKGVRIVVLVPDAMLPLLRERYGNLNVIVESTCDAQVAKYKLGYHPSLQEYFEHVRRASASPRIPLTYVDRNRKWKETEAKGRHKFALILLRPVIWLLRHSRVSRLAFRRLQQKLFTSNIYTDLFDRYQPDLVISNTAGWRMDQYLLREASRRGIKTAAVIVGWDNPSSQGLPGAFVDYVIVWSEVHKHELVDGVDWPAKNVLIGGMPLYDGYISRKWVMPRDEYFKLHDLDPNKKLVAYAATALGISPNFHIVKLLADIINSQSLGEPSQLLVRLHPNHFKPYPHYQEEAKAIYELAKQYPDMHVVAPKEVAKGLERYSGEDFPEKASMLTYCDVLVTIYSTMVVEAALHGKPSVSACIDAPNGWGKKFWVPLHEIPYWPTATRINKANAGKTAMTADELCQYIDEYLANPDLNATERRRFLESELAFLDGESTQVTAKLLLSLLEKGRQI